MVQAREKAEGGRMISDLEGENNKNNMVGKDPHHVAAACTHRWR